MAADSVRRIISQYEAGAMTEGAACLEVLIAAGGGDANAVFDSLPTCLRDAVARRIAGMNPSEARILESACGPSSDEKEAAELQRREELLRRGIVALKGVISGRTGGA